MVLSTIQKIDRLSTDSDLFHSIVHGLATQTIVTEGGEIPTAANAITSLKAFNVRGEWEAGMLLSMKDVVTHAGIAYVAISPSMFVSNDIAADIAAGRITIHQGATVESLAAPGGASLIGFRQSGIGAIQRTVQDKLRESYSLLDFGLVGAGDETALFQVAMDAVSTAGGGRLRVPAGKTFNVTKFIWRNGVVLVGDGVITETSAFSGTSVIALAGEGVIGYTASRVSGAGAIGVIFKNTAVTAGNARGVWLGKDSTLGLGIVPFPEYAALPDHLAGKFTFEQCLFDGFRQEAFFQENGSSLRMTNCFTQNCLKDDAYLSVQRAAVSLYSNDAHLFNCEFSSRPNFNNGAVTSASLFAAAVLMGGDTARANSFITNCVVEGSDVGLVLNQKGVRVNGGRADRNNGHGIVIRSANCVVDGTHAWNNGIAADNTYDAIVIESTGKGAKVWADVVTETVLTRHRYGVRDEVGAASDPADKSDIDVKVKNFGTAPVYQSQTTSGGVRYNSGAGITFGDGATNPNVTGYENFRTNNSTPTAISDFVGGTRGQWVHLLVGDSNTSIVNSATLRTRTNANMQLTVNSVYSWRREGSTWYMAG